MFNKSKGSFSLIRLSIVLLTLVPIVYSEFENHKSQILYAAFLYVPIYFICLGIFILVLIFDIILYFKNKQIKSLTPSIIGVLLIITSISIYKYHKYKMHQKTIFKATTNWVNFKETDIKYIIEFKENNNFLVEELVHQGLLTNYYYGNYTQKDSVFILDSQIGENNISNRFLFRTLKNNNKVEKQLIQLNKNGIEIKNQFQFVVKK